MPAATTTIRVSGLGSCTSSSCFHMFWIIARYGRHFPPPQPPWPVRGSRPAAALISALARPVAAESDVLFILALKGVAADFQQVQESREAQPQADLGAFHVVPSHGDFHQSKPAPLGD